MNINTLIAALTACAALSAIPAQANLVVNGDFEQTTNGAKEFNSDTTAVGWTSTGYNFLFAPGTADGAGSYTSQFNSYLKLWGPGTGANNGLTSTSPTGGNFAAADGAYEVAPIQQTINNLIIGQRYDVGFYWAAAQQSGFNGAQTEQWKVSLGNNTLSTAVYSNPSHGFSGWMHETFSFTAYAGSEVLSFLAVGTPSGVPPFSLLDGVTMNAQVPEPASWALVMVAGIGLVATTMRRRRDKA
jgi:hypothetical protein